MFSVVLNGVLLESYFIGVLTFFIISFSRSCILPFVLSELLLKISPQEIVP